MQTKLKERNTMYWRSRRMLQLDKQRHENNKKGHVSTLLLYYPFWICYCRRYMRTIWAQLIPNISPTSMWFTKLHTLSIYYIEASVHHAFVPGIRLRCLVTRNTYSPQGPNYAYNMTIYQYVSYRKFNFLFYLSCHLMS